jgi:hypothetical protein
MRPCASFAFRCFSHSYVRTNSTGARTHTSTRARTHTHVDARARVHTCSQTHVPFVGPYAFGASNSNVCPSSYTPITTAAECAAAAAASVAAAAGIATTAYGGVMPSISSASACGTNSGQIIGALYPMGCFYYSTGSCMAVGVWFNPDPVGAARPSGRLLCKLRGTAAPTNTGDTNAPTTAAPTAALILSTTSIAWHDTRRCLLCHHVALLHAHSRGSACMCLRSAAEDHFRLGLAGDVSSISIGAFVWRCDSTDCPTRPIGTVCSLTAPNDLLSGTLPAAIGRLSCRSQITSVYAPQP